MLALLAVSDAWFLDFNKSGGKKEKLGKSTPTPRKVVLVAKTVYVPVFASGDDSVPIADRLSPIAPVQTVGAVMADNGRQQGAFDYSSMYLQPPPTYVMYNAGSADVAAAYAAPVPADVYGAAGPQYVQYAAPPPQEVKHHYLISGWLIAPFYFFLFLKTWVMQYGTGEAETPAAPYSPTGSEAEVTEGPTEAPTEAYTTV